MAIKKNFGDQKNKVYVLSKEVRYLKKEICFTFKC